MGQQNKIGNAGDEDIIKPNFKMGGHIDEPAFSHLELNDRKKIVNNPKLRHNINFDPSLYFRTKNLDEKARRSTFWDTMGTQLQAYITRRNEFEKELGDTEWCLPATLKAIRGILETLVPQKDLASVEQTFNADLGNWVANPEKLAMWLSTLLKCHCAPTRDDWVDEMVTQLSKGHRDGDVTLPGCRYAKFAWSIRSNDARPRQLSITGSLTPSFIGDTVHFEQKLFREIIANGRVDIEGAHALFRRAKTLPDMF